MKRSSLAACLSALAALLLGFSRLASAHDFWIEPSTFRPAAGDLVTASLRVGQKVQGDPLPRIPTLIDRFVLKSVHGETPLVGRPGSDPAGAVRVAEAAEAWIAYQSFAYPVTLPAGKFEDYLREEGLEAIVQKRAKNGQTAAEGRERFYRCAKALLAGPGAPQKTGTFETPLGFTLELVPRKNPYALKAGGELPLALSFRGKPAAGILVVAMNRDAPEQRIAARTDARGQVTVPLERAGFWLVKAVLMEPAPAGSGVDWESWWASLTFELAPSLAAKK
ncbi:MAG: DUF4198 domain-containing protein [Thermoanaerobaculia bacterium]